MTGSIERLKLLVGEQAAEFAIWADDLAGDPDGALTGLERWAAAVTHPEVQLRVLLENPKLGRLVVLLLGASERLAEALIQNPEFISWVTDPEFLSRTPSREEIVAEGKKLAEVASGYTHKLDRLRYLRQSWIVRIVLNDLAGTWSQTDVWQALSDLADAIIELAQAIVWDEYAGLKGLHYSCPVSIVAFGKLGGHEVNYSSDIDLVYVAEDGLDDDQERHATRYAEMLGRSLSDAMGRGAMYRVDLRLRPYGSAGPLVPTVRSVRAYYRSYAEEWEYQALLRSRVVVGSQSLRQLWESLRAEYCFRPALSTSAIESMLDMRAKIEKATDDSDIKRSAGGIRDIEFLVQIYQRLHGFENSAVRVRGIVDAVSALEVRGFLNPADSANLREAYIFFRRFEHRLQLEERQTHSIPADSRELAAVARLMGFSTSEPMLAAMESHRAAVREIYGRRLAREQWQSAREQVLARSGSTPSHVENWFDGLDESEAFYESLRDNADSLERVRRLVSMAPKVVDSLRASIGLTESVLSGEIEEPIEPKLLFGQPHTSPKALAGQLNRAFATYGAQVALGILDAAQVGAVMTRLASEFLRATHLAANCTFDLVGLGSLGYGDVGFGSDLDVLLLLRNSERHEQAEDEAQKWLELISTLKQSHSPFSVDLRLRPEGQKGLLVRTYDAFRLYELTGMALWERFALGSARLQVGDPEAEELALWAAYSQPITPERLDELLKMKLRIETERVEPKHGRRHVKLGIGGLSDIEWIVRLHEMRYPTASMARQPRSMVDRIKSLGAARLMTFLEVEALLEAHRHLLGVRTWLWLLGFSKDILPENPDRLDHLAECVKMGSGNEFLAVHDAIIDRTRSIYNEGIERLRA